MSQWHREHPELAGTDADPWMRNAGHRKAVEQCRCGACTPCEQRAEDASAALRDKDHTEGDA